ncbi:hypothetical protein E1A91_D02G235200v1 [Gossypium mustelinum]|uniref:Uncharacterized protein n=1 Tax=Gossypium mustelinum TaxID=34275 RepID=A0A5D2W098_GOSMU|nr:hypothetical protein E1A91_D02G235200v1 [Gossypium mustelinum]
MMMAHAPVSYDSRLSGRARLSKHGLRPFRHFSPLKVLCLFLRFLLLFFFMLWELMFMFVTLILLFLVFGYFRIFDFVFLVLFRLFQFRELGFFFLVLFVLLRFA